MKVVLASGSPQRSEILRKLGVEFEVVTAEVEELAGGLAPGELALANAGMKAEAVVRVASLRKYLRGVWGVVFMIALPQ